MRVVALLGLMVGFVFADGGDENPLEVFKKEDATWVSKTETVRREDGSVYLARKWSYKDGDMTALEMSGEYEMVIRFEHTYNEQGQPTEKKMLDGEDRLSAKYSYSYDKSGGYSVTVHTYDSEEKEDLMSVVHYYNEKGQWTVRHTLMSTDVIGEMKNEFDKDSGLMTKSVVSWVLNGKDMTVTDELSYSYHDSGRLKEKRDVSSAGVIREKEVYDEWGNMLTMETYDRNGDFAKGVELEPIYVDSEDGKSVIKKGETWKIMEGKERKVIDQGKTEIDYVVEK